MENATKALIIAAAILIAIVLISLGVFVLGQGTEMVKDNSDMTDAQVLAYNSEIEAYLGDNISASKLKQFIKFVNEHNRNVTEDSKKIQLTSKGPGNLIININTNTEYQYTSENVSNKDLYKVVLWSTSEGYTSAGLIKNINIMKKK